MIPAASDTSAAGRLALLRLLQIASPALPVGAFAYSQGLESAVAAALVRDEASAASWILGLLEGPIAHLDLAIVARAHRAWATGDVAAAHRWNAFLLASRPTAELQAEERHLGSSLARVLATLGLFDPALEGHGGETTMASPTFASLFGLATARWKIDVRWALEAFAFSWAQAQASAAVRLVPLGQSSGVRILADIARAIPSAVDGTLSLADDDVGATAPLQAVLSSAHETQYSRLFRS
jgi:urease accessory protein